MPEVSVEGLEAEIYGTLSGNPYMLRVEAAGNFREYTLFLGRTPHKVLHLTSPADPADILEHVKAHLPPGYNSNSQITRGKGGIAHFIITRIPRRA